jgi:hypothetical protein
MALEIEHTHLPIRGLNLHVAHVGKGESLTSHHHLLQLS